MSYRTLTAKPLNASLKTLLKRGGHIGVGLGAFTPILALANPTGGKLDVCVRVVVVVWAIATALVNPAVAASIVTNRRISMV